MGGKFTQKRASRNLSLPALARLTEQQAFDLLRHIRFADTQGEPYCPRCWKKYGIRLCVRADFRPDDRWLCRGCRATFSLFTSTSWEYKHRPYLRMLLILGNFLTNSSGEPSIEIARKSDTDPTSTYYFVMDVREALGWTMNNETLSGEVEVDGCYVGGFKRPLNDRALEQKLKREGRWVKPPKKVICLMRERSSGRIVIGVHRAEHEFVPTVIKQVAPGSIVYTDMAESWTPLGAHFDLRSVNHKEHYWTEEASTQLAEATFHRLRRCEKNLVHISGDYADLYAAEIAFRETYCRQSDAEKFVRLIALCMKAPPSKRFKKVWQRPKKKQKPVRKRRIT